MTVVASPLLQACILYNIELISRDFQIGKTNTYSTVFINLGDVKLSVAEGEVPDLLNYVISVKAANLFFLFLFFHHNTKCPELSV